MTTFSLCLLSLIAGMAISRAYSLKEIRKAKADALRFLVPYRRLDLSPEDVVRREGF